MATAALGFTAANRATIIQDEHRIDNLEHKTDYMVKIEHLHEAHLKHLDSRLNQTWEMMKEISEDDSAQVAKMCDYTEKHHSMVNQQVKEIIDAAFRHRLAPGAVHIDALWSIVHHVQSIAEKNNMISYVTNPSDLFQVEVSSIFHPADQIIALLLHVPLVHTDNLMTIMQYVQLPLIHNSSANFTLTPDVGQKDLLAIGSTEFFNTLSSSDLENCVRLGDTYFCKGRRELRTDTEQECLTSLYFGVIDHIRRNCGFKISHAREQVFEVEENTWLIFSMGQIATNQVCSKQKMTPMKINSGDTITVKPGCAIRTQEHVLVADNTIELEVEKNWANPQWSLDDIFPDHHTDTIIRALESLKKQGANQVQATDLFLRLDELSRPESHWTFSLPMATLAVSIMGLLIVGCCLWTRNRIQKNQAGTNPPAYKLTAPTAPTFNVVY